MHEKVCQVFELLPRLASQEDADILYQRGTQSSRSHGSPSSVNSPSNMPPHRGIEPWCSFWFDLAAPAQGRSTVGVAFERVAGGRYCGQKTALGVFFGLEIPHF